MDKQAVFEKVAAHLLTQNKKAEVRDPYMNSTRCMYRGYHGSKCAVGALIPDSKYTQDMENAVAQAIADHVRRGEEPSEVQRPLYEVLRHEVGAKTTEDWLLLADLQSTHDNHNPNEWPARLNKVAESWELTALT